MGLFSKYANLYFIVGRKIIEAANKDGTISEHELYEIAEKYGVSEDYFDFVNALIGKSNENNKFHGITILEAAGARTYRSQIHHMPLVLSTEERKALAESFSSDIASAFVTEKILAKFGVALQASVLTENLGKVVVAIKTERWIVFDNNTAVGMQYFGQHLRPQKIEHSLTTGVYYISGYCKESARLIKCNLARITIHAIENDEPVDVDNALIQKRCSEPIRLSIENQKNVIDRAFNMFSGYEKDGFYDKKTGRYELGIFYYDFEEWAIIDKVLSLGAVAVVVSPFKVKEKVIGRVRQQLTKLT